MDKLFEEKMKQYLKKINIEINDRQISNFYNYMNLLLEWNEKINLTAITEQNEIILKHFVDSLTIMDYIDEHEKVVDIGTGAGFPGIPLAIMKSFNDFTLVDSLNKRINFLDEVKAKLDLENVNTLHIRAEEFGRNKIHREKYDVAVSRAVANLSVLVEYLIPTVKLGGRIICMKGSQIEEELKEASNAINELGGAIKFRKEFELPETDMKRNIIVIQKIKDTPKKYPRKAGVPTKKPIQ